MYECYSYILFLCEVITIGPLKSVKQEKFCQIYAATGNATQAFKEAGYKWTSENAARVRACELCNKNSNIQNRIRELAEEAKTDAIADIQEMQETLTKIIREELDEEIFLSEGTGEGYSRIVSKRKKAALRERTKAIELLARMQGAFLDKVEVSGTLPVIISGEEKLED